MVDRVVGIRITADAKEASAALLKIRQEIELAGRSAGSTNSQLVGLNGQLLSTGRAGQSAADGLSKAGKAAKDAKAGAGGLAGSMDDLKKSMAGAAAGYLTFQAALNAGRALVQAADAATLMASRLRLVTSTTQEFAAAQQKIFELSQRTSTSLQQTTQLYSRLGIASDNTGRSMEQLLRVTDIVGKALRLSGASVAEASGSLLQFSQMIGGATVQAQEYNSIVDGMPIIAIKAAKAMGMSAAELKRAVNDQKVSTEEFLQAILKAGEEIDAMSVNLPKTFGASMQQLSNSLVAWIGDLDSAIQMSRNFSIAIAQITGAMDKAGGRVTEGSMKSARKSFFEAGDELRAEFEKYGTSRIGTLTDLMRKYQEASAELEKLTSKQDESNKAIADSSKRTAEQFGASVGKIGQDMAATLKAVADEAKRQNVPEALAQAVFMRETGWKGKGFQQLTSPVGARGVMQLMPGTASQLGVDMNNAVDNIKGGVTYLKQMLERFNGDFRLAVAAYNAGPVAVEKRNAATAFKETREYVAFVEDYIRKHPDGAKLFEDSDKAIKQQQASLKEALGAFADAKDNEVEIAKASATEQVAVLETQLAKQMAALEEYRRQQKAALEAMPAGSDKTAAASKSASGEQALLRDIAATKAAILDTTIRTAAAERDAMSAQIAYAQARGVDAATVQQLIAQRRTAEAEVNSKLEERKRLEIEAGTALARTAEVSRAAAEEEARASAKSVESRQELIDKLDQQYARIMQLSDAENIRAQAQQAAAGMAAEAHDAYMAQIDQRIKRNDEAAAKKAKQEREEKAVGDRVLRMSKYYDEMTKAAVNAARAMEESFGAAGKAAGGIVVALANAASQSNAIQAKMEEDLKKSKDSGESPEKQAEIQKRAAMDQARAQIQSYGDMAQAARGFFKEGSEGYSKMDKVAKVFRMAEMAMTVANYAKMAAESMGFFAGEIARSQASATAKGAEAVAHQGTSGDPYSAIPRMIAMIAMLASIGVMVGGGGGGGGASTSKRVERVNNGTVLGGAEGEASNSISNALEILRDNSSTDLDYSAKMTRSLQNIEIAMTGVTRSMLLNVNAMSALAGKSIKKPGMATGLFGEPILFGSVKQTVTDYGLGTLTPQKLADILKDGIKLTSFTDVKTESKLFGMTLSSRTKTYLGDVADETERAFTLVISSLADAVKEGAKAFGINSVEFERKLQDFVVSIDPISMKDASGKQLTGDALQEAIQGQFSAIADKMAAALNIEGLRDFQIAGEGLFETLTRVASGINEAKGALGQLNIAAISYTEVQLKSAKDIGAEIVRQSIIAREAGSSVGAFMADAVGGVEDLVETYKDLVAIRDAFNSIGLEAEGLTRAMSEAVGGVANLRSAVEDFVSGFYSAGEQFGVQMTTLVRSFGELGYALPTSKEEFRSLAEGIDTSTEAGQQLFARLIALSGAFADAADQAEALEEKYAKYTNPMSNLAKRVTEVMDDFAEIIDYKMAAIDAKFASAAGVEKRAANGELNNGIGVIGSRRTAAQSEIDRNMGYLAQVQANIDELQSRINRWSGVKGAAGYVAAWQGELQAALDNKAVLEASIRKTSDEIRSLTAAIERSNAEIKANDARIDAGQAAAKIQEMTAERNRLLQEQGAAIIGAVTDILKEMNGIFDQLEQSLAKNIADLQGGRAPFKLAKANERRANASLNAYIGQGGSDPEKSVELITDAMNATMDRYNQELAILTAKAERERDKQERQIRNASAKVIRGIERQRDIDLRGVDQQGEARADAARARNEARVKAINDGMEAALQALQDAQDLARDALQEDQENRREAIQKVHSAQMEVLQTELSQINAMKSALKGIADAARQLLVGTNSSLSPEAKLAEAQAQFDALVAKARGGDAEAAGKVAGAGNTLVELLRSYFGSNSQFSAAFQQVYDTMSSLGGMDPGSEESVQSKIEALQESQAAELKALQKVFSAESKALSREQSKAADALRQTFQVKIDAANAALDRQLEAIDRQTERQRTAIERAADKQIAAEERRADKLVRDLADPEKNEAIRQLKERTVAKLTKLQEALDAARAQQKDHMQSMVNSLIDLNVLGVRQLRALNKIVVANGLDPVPVPKMAVGGLAKPGITLVGEQGPELVDFSRPGRVYTAAQSSELLGNGNDELVAEVKALRTEMKAVVTTQSAANPQIIEELRQMNERLSTVERLARVA